MVTEGGKCLIGQAAYSPLLPPFFGGSLLVGQYPASETVSTISIQTWNTLSRISAPKRAGAREPPLRRGLRVFFKAPHFWRDHPARLARLFVAAEGSS